MTDDFNDIFKFNMADEWMNGAYDEMGGSAVCDVCRSELRWNPEKQDYECPSCGQNMDRIAYFNHIGAEPPGSICLTSCNENYPFCKKYCLHYTFDPNDPMM